MLLQRSQPGHDVRNDRLHNRSLLSTCKANLQRFKYSFLEQPQSIDIDELLFGSEEGNALEGH